MKNIDILLDLLKHADLRTSEESDGCTDTPIKSDKSELGDELSELVDQYNEQQVLLNAINSALIKKFRRIYEISNEIEYKGDDTEILKKLGDSLNAGVMQYDAYSSHYRVLKKNGLI